MKKTGLLILAALCSLALGACGAQNLGLEQQPSREASARRIPAPAAIERAGDVLGSLKLPEPAASKWYQDID